MKIFITNREMDKADDIVKAICSEAVSTVTETVADIFEDSDGIGITPESIERANKTCEGVLTITQSDEGYWFDFNEDVVVATGELVKDFVIDFFDVLKYAMKTFVAFGEVKVKHYMDKIKLVINVKKDEVK